ncbi:hypothetical protein VOLCADRAFT_93382 [Volvox carteri f. nagariensis]|uniref:PAS domain-containing protein n=1 Tax=Volvox carteri f. nagariensis TaxID=3068 RepID=D8U1Z5_VOLCA|nr:uncharacterized protein VOLCADRAFT_93382 [Volvox carteri f. nagariensis]EFJ46271.1 hypothetical protein VOLCADRAFT_93382 [Volvox carteri f. nagariensis]|eukprot:XP_002952718.1 hypothetical protein VOLCADRAFT_93382 [Volvox carteri f. nagariensis]
MSSIGSGSIRSGTSADVSETSSQKSDAQMLRKHKRSEEENEEGDLLEQRRSFQEGVFACMYTLVRQSVLSNWKFAVLKIILEGLMPFIVVFNPSADWSIETGNPVWQVVRWVVWRSPIMRMYGYDVYIRVMYVMAGAVFLAVAGLIWLTLAMRKQEQSKWLRQMAIALNVVYELMFMVFYVSFMDYFMFTANCKFTAAGQEHEYFKGVKCFQMPHVLHMSVALCTAAVHLGVTALLVVASSDLNPLSQGYLASPDVASRLKILAAKAAFIVCADDLQAWPRVQVVLMAVAVGFICWYNFRKLPFYRLAVNVIWCSMWICVWYTCVLLAVLVFAKDQSLEQRRLYTLYVLYGIFPVLVGGIVVCLAHAWWAMRPARKFEELPSFRDVRVQKLHRFAHVHEVELLSRVMRRFDRDGDVDEDAAALGDAVIRAGMLTFPNSPFLNVMYANYLLSVRKDGPAARTQLQLAAKHGPSLVERYQIYCTLESSKRLKDSQDGGMDLQAYIEFRRNFKAVLRVHRDVLALELELWRTCLRTSLRVATIDALLDQLEAATGRAHQVYKKVLERYPTNGKLLRCYGKFLEDVRHDAPAAARVYAEAARCGGADAIMSLDLSAIQQATEKPDFLTSLSLLDDAVVVINAEGTIMMVSQVVQSVFGYSKAELEGANVNLLMPQPFSQRHSSYLSRYVATGEPHILDAVREVVGLHKDRYVFPVDLCVTKMSGSGSDSVFLGVLRPLPPSTLRVRAWLAPNGTFLCGDQQFASLCGLMENDLVGRSLASLCANPDSEVSALLERFRAASAQELVSGVVRCELLLRHRFLDPVAVEVVVGLSGTDGQRIMALSCRRADGREGNLLVVDTHMRLRFASLGLSTLLNYPMRKLATMRLDQLLQPPYNTLHAKWLRDPPHTPSVTSCRSGRVVHLLNDAGVAVPVRIKVSPAAGDVGMSLYVVQVERVHVDELLEEKRLVVMADFSGRVQSVSRPDSSLFGFPALELLGRNLCDCIDVFGDWRRRAGESQLQLLVLALVDREQEMPGTSWRVRVHSPASSEDLSKMPPLAAALPSMRRKPGAGSISACLQVELLDDTTEDNAEAGGGTGSKRWQKLLLGGEDDILGISGGAAAAKATAAAAAGGEAGGGGGGGGNVHIKLTLWRRDLLTGMVELDEQLQIRKASYMTGLMVGLPSTAMLRKPLHKFLDLPHRKTWAQISDSAHKSHKRSALKISRNHGALVSPQMAFLGPHPDMGTMRILVQGVQTLAPGGRQTVNAVLHPDTTYVGAHADLLRVLHLEGSEAGKGGAGSRGGAEAAATGPTHDHFKRTVSRRASGDKDGVTPTVRRRGVRAAAAAAAAAAAVASRVPFLISPLTHTGASKSEFVAQWVRTVSKRSMIVSVPLDLPDPDPDPDTVVYTPTRHAAAAVVGPVGQPGEQQQQQQQLGAAAGVQEQGSSAAKSPTTATGSQPSSSSALVTHPLVHPLALKHTLVIAQSRRLPTVPEDVHPLRLGAVVDADEGEGEGLGGGSGGGDGGGGGGRTLDATVAADKWERNSDGGDSSADGSQAASGVTSLTDNQSAIDVVVDARRGKLLKSLQKLLMGPLLMAPLERLRLHSYCLLALMLATHIACYVVVTKVVSKEHTGVYMVHRQARAMDRASLLVVRILIGTFCERANNTAKVSACTPPLSVHLNNMVASVTTLEQDHQGVYLGFSTSKVTAPSSRVYGIWTNPQWEYDVYMDTQPPRVLAQKTGVWQLGNRFIAASREALYWMPKLRDEFKFHPVYQFMVTNGLGPLFVGYATSLDELMAAAWASLDNLKTVLIIVLVVEVLVVQLSCLGYEWLLMHRLERARLMGMLSMVGLPGPVLRQMGSREVKVLDESDDELDDDASAKDGGEQEQGGGGGDDGTAAGFSKKDNGSGDGSGGGGKEGGAGGGDRTGGGVRLMPPSPVARTGGGGRGCDAGNRGDTAEAVQRDGSEQSGGTGGGEGGETPDRRNGGTAAVAAAAAKSAAAAGARGVGGGGIGGRRRRSLLLEAAASGDGGGEDTELLALEGPATQTAVSTTVSAMTSATATAAAGGRTGRFTTASRSHKARWTVAGAGTQYINGKALVLSKWRDVRFMLLPVLWFAGVLAIYTASILSLSGMQGPLATLNMACHVVYRYTRVRAVGFSFLTQDDTASRALWRDMLRTEVRLFANEYDALMYGGTAASQVNSVFTHAVPPSTFASSAFAEAFFKTKRCFRFNQSLCAKVGSPYYEVTHNGLDVMVRRMIMEMELLISDADEDVAYNGTRWTFMYNVGTFDLYEGLQQAAQLFVDYSISKYNSVTTLHTILLVATILLFAVYIVFVLWPHLAKLKADAARQSALLSHVPAEVDTVGHVKAIVRAARSAAAARRASAGSATGKSPTVATATGV